MTVTENQWLSREFRATSIWLSFIASAKAHILLQYVLICVNHIIVSTSCKSCKREVEFHQTLAECHIWLCNQVQYEKLWEYTSIYWSILFQYSFDSYATTNIDSNILWVVVRITPMQQPFGKPVAGGPRQTWAFGPWSSNGGTISRSWDLPKSKPENSQD